MDSFLEIQKAKYEGGFRLRLWFNNGEVRLVDLSDKLCGEAFEPLLDRDYFQHFSIPLNTVEWENGADFAPEYLYEISSQVPFNLEEDVPLPTAAEPQSAE